MAENSETQVTEKPPEEGKKWVHPLKGRKVLGGEPRDYSWQAWLFDWNRETYTVSLINHLHIAYDSEPKSCKERQARTLFFLDHAMSHCSAGNVCPECKIAEKAASVLCQRVFKNASSSAMPSWFPDILDAEVLPKLFEFLDNFSGHGSSRSFDYRNVLTAHEKIILKEFLLKLCLFAWNSEFFWRDRMYPPWSEHREKLDEWRNLLSAHRIGFMRILLQMGELDRLWMHREGIDAVDIGILRGLVFAKPRDRKSSDEVPASLEEALVSKEWRRNEPARVLCYLEAFFKETERRKAEYEGAKALVEEVASRIKDEREEIAKIQLFFMNAGSASFGFGDLQEKQRALGARQETLRSLESSLFQVRASLATLREKYGY
ncbi:MAG: hypothetical protein LiPW15_348 [Parcubacteria group bacterium LiPW_15]|nr:MAG: hypothetical protein LiPW15_348 [Parcubacteria group bacterium LiPW_15]